MTAKKINSAFTLIELLIVIAILGTLAVVVLLALNPAQQLARTRDAGRISAVTQIGHAIEANSVGNDGVYQVADATWMADLVTAGEISVTPAIINYSITTVACTSFNVNNLCYKNVASTGAIVYTTLESNSNISKCPTGQKAFAVYSTADGRGGIICTLTEPAAGTQGTNWK